MHKVFRLYLVNNFCVDMYDQE